MCPIQNAVCGTWLKPMQLSPAIAVSTRVICTQSGVIGSSGALGHGGKVNTRHYFSSFYHLNVIHAEYVFITPKGVTVYLRWSSVKFKKMLTIHMILSFLQMHVFCFKGLAVWCDDYVIDTVWCTCCIFSSRGHVCHSIFWVVTLPHLTWGFNFSFVSGFLVGLKASAT